MTALRTLRRHVTYANVAATLALVLALGTGGAVAASKFISGSRLAPGSVSER